MKLDKSVVKRRVNLLKEEGIEFIVNTEISTDIPADELKDKFDALILAGGATNPRDLPIDGRDLNGIHFAMDFCMLIPKAFWIQIIMTITYISAKDKNVIVIGGGDTGTDCVSTSMRHKCKSLTQFEIMPKPPNDRADENPWPEWPNVYKLDYGQEEARKKFGDDPS